RSGLVGARASGRWLMAKKSLNDKMARGPRERLLQFACMRVILLSCHLIIGMPFLGSSLARAQDREPPSLRLSGLLPGGVRNSLTESWGRLDFKLTNTTDTDRRARVF